MTSRSLKQPLTWHNPRGMSLYQVFDVGVICRMAEKDKVPELGDSLRCLGRAEQELYDCSNIGHKFGLVKVREVDDVANHLLDTLKNESSLVILPLCLSATYMQKLWKHVFRHQLISIELVRC